MSAYHFGIYPDTNSCCHWPTPSSEDESAPLLLLAFWSLAYLCPFIRYFSYANVRIKTEMKKQTRNKNVPKKSKATENVENN